MSVGRNDPCPCGSGKKYKQCCLKNENKKQLKEQQREKFYEAKQDLVEKIGDYLVQQVPIKQYDQLKEKFSERTAGKIEEDIEESYFTFWLYFFYRFENGLRGIEWFYQGNLNKLTSEERTMTENWLKMKARFLQAVDQTNEIVIFEDMLSKERFPVSGHEENLASIYPWMSTLAMIEPFDGEYYFNGLRFTVSPYMIGSGLKYIETLKNETQLDEQQILADYFPEILAKLLEPADTAENFVDVVEYSLTYSLQNPVLVAEFLRHQPDIKVEEWEKTKQEFIWSGNWRLCKDNACPGEIKLADAYGNLFLQDETLIYVGIEKEKQQEIKERLTKIEHALTLENEEEKVIGSYSAKPSSVLVIFDEIIPDYFTFYAQNNLMKEIDEPIPMYGNKSIRELMETGQEDLAVQWLKNLEFNVYRQVTNQFDEVEVTADFNTVRREIGMELSPFVTGGSHRKTVYEPLDMSEDQYQIYQSDVPFLEDIGFRPNTINNFYMADLLRFYKENNHETNRKNLFELRELLERSVCKDWAEVSEDQWKNLLLTDYKTLLDKDYNEKRHEAFLTGIKEFLLWLTVMKNKDFQEVIKMIENWQENNLSE